MSPYLAALRRFWWVVNIGVIVASVAAVLVSNKVDFSSFPPALSQRFEPTYTTSARLLVTSPDVPYLRVTSSEPAAPAPSSTAAGEEALADRPDLAILVRAANLYPLLIESDRVAELRDRMFGPIPGEVKAQAVFAVVNANRYEPSKLPVIEVFAESNTPAQAVNLTQATTRAFKRFIRTEQNAAGLKPDQRILLQQLQRPSDPVASGGPVLGLIILVVLTLLLAFAALCVLLDRIFPAGREHGTARDEGLAHDIGVSNT